MKTIVKTEHGGSVRKGMRKCARPLRTDRLMHVVFRSSLATGERSFLRPANAAKIAEILDRTVGESGVRIKRYRNVGNHFHFLVRGEGPGELRKFFRLFPQRVALALGGAKKGRPRGKFFDETVYSRVVEWGTDYANVEDYLVKNAFEQLGFSATEVRALYRQVKTLPVNRMLYLERVHYRGKDLA